MSTSTKRVARTEVGREDDLPTGLAADVPPLLQLGDLVRQHPPIVLQLPEPFQDVGESRAVTTNPAAATAATGGVFTSPLPHERQDSAGAVPAVDKPVRGARAAGHAVYPIRGCPGHRIAAAWGPVSVASSIQARDRVAPGRRAKDAGQPFTGHEKREGACEAGGGSRL